MEARQYDTAITDAHERLESMPNESKLFFVLSEAYRRKGMLKEAVETQERYLLLSGNKAAAEGMQHAFEQGGYKAVLHWQISAMERDSATKYVSPVLLANLYAQLGQREKTLALLEEGFQQHSPQVLFIQNDPAFDFLHTDERYRSLIQRIGLPPSY
jgi:tetratricopeptide (TPR) repeat protein